MLTFPAVKTVLIVTCVVCSFRQGYKQPKAFIVSQGPLTTTCSDFWKMIYDRKCAAIVMLSHLREGGEVGQ